MMSLFHLLTDQHKVNIFLVTVIMSSEHIQPG